MVEISDDEFERNWSETSSTRCRTTWSGRWRTSPSSSRTSRRAPARGCTGCTAGHPLTRRGVYGFGELPDRITLFRNNLEAGARDLDELRARVRVTLVHEIGHYFGLATTPVCELGWAYAAA